MRVAMLSATFRVKGFHAITIVLCGMVLWCQRIPATAQEPDGVIAGVVVDAVSGRPLSGATVMLSGDARRNLSPIVSGSSGSFRIEGLPPGRYGLSARIANYIGGKYGQRYAEDSDRPVELALHERRTDLTVPLWALATIEGRVLDSRQEAIVFARVVALRRSVERGRFGLRRQLEARTNDRGEYRLSVAPGSYVLAVEAYAGQAQAGRLGYPTTFYPGTLRASDAMVIELAGGEQMVLDFTTQRLAPVRVAGRVDTDAPHGPSGALRVVLLEDQATTSCELPMATATVGPKGTFTFAAVFPGQYILRAVDTPLAPELQVARITPQGMSFSGTRSPIFGAPLPPTRRSQTLFAEAPVAVASEDVQGLLLTMRPAATIAGTVVFDGASLPTSAQLESSAVVIMPVDGRETGVPITRIESDSTFHSVGLPPGPYAVGLMLSFPGYSLKSVQQAGVEVSGDAIEVGLSDVTGIVLSMSSRPSDMKGAVRDLDGRPLDGASVYVFPADERQWNTYFPNFSRRWNALRTSRDGTFQSKNLPAGSYVVAAISGSVPQTWQTAESLDRLGAVGTTVNVREGQSVQVSLRASAWPGGARR